MTSIPTKWHWVDSDRQLAQLCEGWGELPALGIDTEFMRTRTYFPKLALVQVCDGADNWLIDALAIADPAPFAALLSNSNIHKIMHSGGGDLEVLYHHFGVMPEGLFDTQIAEVITGGAFSLGYAKLVAREFDIELPKGETRSNWLRRPLTPQQQSYAALDVAYLPELYRRQQLALRAQDREAWFAQEMTGMADTERFLPAPETLWLKTKRPADLTPIQLAVLRDLVTWREREARRKDLPRGFVLEDKTLLGLAIDQPATDGAMEIDGATRRRYGEQLLQLIQQSQSSDPQSWPTAAANADDWQQEKALTEQLLKKARAIASSHGIAPEFLASRKLLAQLASRLVAQNPTPWTPALEGWRRELLENELLALVD